MSDEPKPPAPPSPPPPPPAPALVPPPVGSAPPMPPKPAGPVIEYAMPRQKSFIPSPALIKNLGCLFKLLFGFAVLLCMGYFALVALNPKARQWALQGTKPGPGGAPPSGKGPTPFTTVNQILAIPAQALGKTDDVVKANNARAGQVDTLVAEEEAKAKGAKPGRTFAPVTDPFASPTAPDKTPAPAAAGTAATESTESPGVSRAALLALAEKSAATTPPVDPAPVAPPKPVPAAPAAPDSPEQIKLAGNIIIAHASPTGSPRASAAFFFWIVNLNVSGITQSKPARLLLNGRLAYEGDVVNRSLGITFAQLDAAGQLLVFRDSTGATVTRSY